MKIISISKITTALLACLSLSGCMFAPGMHMNDDSLTPTVNAENHVVTPHIQIIDATLIQQEQQQAEIETALAIKNYTPPKGFISNPQNYHYEIGPQDRLSIMVWDYPTVRNPLTSATAGTSSTNTNQTTVAVTVDSKGNIYYPYVGNVKVAGLTTDQIRSLLTAKLALILKNPQVSVSVSKFASQHIVVTGAVRLPAVLPITNAPLTILEAVTKAMPTRCGTSISTGGSQTICADLQKVKLVQNQQTTTVNLNTLQAPTGSSTNWILKNGARIYVPNNNRDRVFVLGAVKSPGPYNMIDGNMSLKEALGDARGVTVGSNPGYTYIIRNYQDNPQIFSLNANSPDAFNLAGEFILKPEDVVFVSTSRLQTFNDVLNQITPTLMTAVYTRSLTQ